MQLRYQILILAMVGTKVFGANSPRISVDTRDSHLSAFASSSVLTVDTREFAAAANTSSTVVDTRDNHIVVEQPQGTPLNNGVSVTEFGVIGSHQIASRVYFIRNNENITHYNLMAQVLGPDSGDFVVGQLSSTSLTPGAVATFTVMFTPRETGVRTSQIRITADSFSGGVYTFGLRGSAYSSSLDSDGDGMSDLAENLMLEMGFDWQINQEALVDTYFSTANTNGLFSESQIHALNLDSPLLKRSSTSGDFTLTIGLNKSTDLVHFSDFPMLGSQVSVNSEGKIEFRFTSDDSAAFFRLIAQ